jgi:hypothetical protein
MTRDDIAHLMNDTAPRLSGWGTEAHFQNFAQALMKMVAAAEREACAEVCDDEALRCEAAVQRAEPDEVSAIRSTAWKISVCAAAIRKRGAK